MIWVGILAMLIVIILLLLLMHVRVRVDLTHHNRDTDGVVDLRYLFGLIHLKRHLFAIETILTDEGPAVKATHSSILKQPKDGSEKSIMTFKEVVRIVLNWPSWMNLARELWNPMEDFLRRVHVEQLDFAASVGTGDVVLTGIAYGSLWAVVSSSVGRLTHLCQFERNPNLRIEPDFKSPALGTDVHCILRVRAGYAMWAAMRLIRVWKRRKTDGSSHSGAHENSNGKHSRNG